VQPRGRIGELAVERSERGVGDSHGGLDLWIGLEPSRIAPRSKSSAIRNNALPATRLRRATSR